MPAPKKYPDELRKRAVRLYRESDPKPVIRQLAEQLSVHPEALRNWIRQDEADSGQRHDRPSTDMVEENRRLKRENAELKRVNEVLRAASAYFASEIVPTRSFNDCVKPLGMWSVVRGGTRGHRAAVPR